MKPKQAILINLITTLALIALVITNLANAVILTEDLNNDGTVDIVDITMAMQAYKSTPISQNWNPQADINKDNKIDITDIANIIAKHGRYVPTAAFIITPQTAPKGTPIQLDPTSSYDPDGAIILYQWDTNNDGTPENTTTAPQIITLIYYTPGARNITLTVTDNHGYTATATHTITTTSITPVPEIPLGTLAATITMTLALAAYLLKPRLTRKIKTTLSA